MAPQLGISPGEVHALIDLLTDILDEILGAPDYEYVEGESARRMADRLGWSTEKAQEFIDLWEQISTEEKP